jgi:hypothetical protein
MESISNQQLKNQLNMKVYVITETSDNGEQFEDYREFTDVIAVYSSMELAEKAMAQLPTEVPARQDVAYEYTDEHPNGVPKMDENGSIMYETISWTTPLYSIHERDLIES